MQVDEARRYSRSVGLSWCESVNGTPGSCSASSSPTRRSWAGLAIDHSRQTPTASTCLAASAPITARAAGLVERLDDLAAGADPLGDLEGQRARHVGLGIGHGEVEGLDPAAFADHQDVGMALGGQERGARGRCRSGSR